MDLTENFCLETIYNLHSKSEDRMYAELQEKVVGDVLMNKIKNNKLIGITPFVIDTIKDFYIVANDLYKRFRFEKGCRYIVYRGTKHFGNYYTGDKVVQPIPFSTSLDEKNMEEWIGAPESPTGKTCCKWHIQIPLNTRFVGLDNPNEGREILLPAGILYIKNMNIDSEGITNYYCFLKPTKTFRDMVKLQKMYKFI